MIEIRDVSLSYGPVKVLHDVSVSIPKGGITAIIGPNGAGKSTLLSLVGRLLRMQSGSIVVDGLDIGSVKGDEMARKLAILRQNQHLTVRLSVEDLVLFGRYPYSKGRPTVEDQRLMEAALEYVELTPFRHRYLDELSGGQRQRAFVAMVLCQDTEYVLLDEPLNSLDMKHAVSLMKRLRGVTDELGKTVVIVLHDINFASAYADGIVALKDGRLVRHGPPAEIMTPDVLESIYDIDVRVEEIGGRRVGVYYG